MDCVVEGRIVREGNVQTTGQLCFRPPSVVCTLQYWKGTLKPRPTVDWYLNKLDSAVDAAKRATRGGRVALLAHSAGGWLGRVYMRDFGSFGIESFTTLGAPHRPPPPGALDQTRGILTFCEQAVPGAFHDSVRYTTVAGKLIKGADFEGEGSIEQKLVGAGYAQICGEAGVWGDGECATQGRLHDLYQPCALTLLLRHSDATQSLCCVAPTASSLCRAARPFHSSEPLTSTPSSRRLTEPIQLGLPAHRGGSAVTSTCSRRRNRARGLRHAGRGGTGGP